MINASLITKGVKDLFDNNLFGYFIERNTSENLDESTASRNKGWIGIYKGPVSYEAARIGSIKWDAEVKVIVEIQCASFKSGEDAENRLEESVKEVMDLLDANPKLNDTVATTIGYEIEYDFERKGEPYFQIALITIISQVQT